MMTTTCERGNKRAHFNFMSLGCESQQITTTKRQIRKCRLRMYKFYCYFKRSEWNINQPLKETKWNHDSHQN